MNEYTIDTNGITLSTPWQDADHINVRTQTSTTNFHTEAKCAAIPAHAECSPIMVSAAQHIGDTFIPWADLGLDPSACIEWVQFSRANYHFGEAGEAPLCLTVTEQPPVIPPLDCPEGKVPGWLDENGNPQGCVDNNPTPLEPKPENPGNVIPKPEPVPVPDTIEQVTTQPTEQPAELAETGVADTLGLALLAAVLIAGGVALMRKARHA